MEVAFPSGHAAAVLMKHMCMCGCLKEEPEEGVRSPGAGVIGSCKPPVLGVAR